MAFQLIPFFDEPYDWMDVAPMRRQYQQSPLAQLNRLSRQLHHLQDHMMDAGSEVSMKGDCFNVNLDVDGFKPKDLNVSVKEDMLTVTGNHEEKSEDGSRYVSRQFTRSYRLPERAQLDRMKSTLAADGRTLRIETPVAKPEPVQQQAKAIPIEIHRSAPEPIKQG